MTPPPVQSRPAALAVVLTLSSIAALEGVECFAPFLLRPPSPSVAIGNVRPSLPATRGPSLPPAASLPPFLFRCRPLGMSSASSSPSPSVLPKTSPLSPSTFAGKIENALLTKFGSTNVARVIESFRLLEAGYEHHEYVGSQQPVPPLDAEESRCHQKAHSYVPGLTPLEFWDVSDVKWAKILESKYDVIKNEFQRVTSDMDRLTKEGNNVWAGALTDDAAGYGKGWSTLVLLDRGTWDATNVNLFPETSRIVKDCGVPAVEVFFASMKPRSDIKRHSDNTNFVVTSHLALDIPESGSNKCRLSVGDTTKQWINGEVTMFDTSILHDAINESDKTRYILMIRLWHPDLTQAERDALQFVYDCLEVPELVSDDPGERFVAERRLEMMRTFPEIKAERRREEARGFEGGKSRKGRKKEKRRGGGGGGGKGFGS